MRQPLPRHRGNWELQIWTGSMWKALCLVCGFERGREGLNCTTCGKLLYRRKHLLDILGEAREILKTMALDNGANIWADEELRLFTHLSVGKIPHLCASRTGMRVYHTQTYEQFSARELLIMTAGTCQEPERN